MERKKITHGNDLAFTTTTGFSNCDFERRASMMISSIGENSLRKRLKCGKCSFVKTFRGNSVKNSHRGYLSLSIAPCHKKDRSNQS